MSNSAANGAHWVSAPDGVVAETAAGRLLPGVRRCLLRVETPRRPQGWTRAATTPRDDPGGCGSDGRLGGWWAGEHDGSGLGRYRFPAGQVIGHHGVWGAFAFWSPELDAVITGTVNTGRVDRRPLLGAVVRALTD